MNEMQFQYFYGSQAEQFSFYRLPKALITDPKFSGISSDAKILYGVMLDRMSLSIKNHWSGFKKQSLYHIYIGRRNGNLCLQRKKSEPAHE